MGRRAPRGLFFSPALAAMVVAAACGTADNRVDPGDLELRDLLGISPQPASQWDGGERLAARRVIAQSLDDELPERRVASEPLAPFRDDVARDAVVIAALARWDERVAAEGWPARVLLRVAAPPGMLRATLHATSRTREAVSGRAPAAAGATSATSTAAVGAEGDLALELAPAWNDEPLIELTSRGAAELTALARDAGHAAGPLVAVPAPRLAVLAAYLEPSRAGATPRLLVNPVLLAALEASSGDPLGPGQGTDGVGGSSEGSSETDRYAAGDPGSGNGGGGVSEPPDADGGGTGAMAVGGNPYSFYGSVAECAYAQRLRCEACLPNGTCEPITNISDGNAECEMLGASSGRGYFLQCINLSLAISSVDECTADRAPSCPRDRDAASSLTSLEANARFLDEDGCKVGLDACLAKIYGAPEIEYPGPGGGGEPPPPPRDINVDCDNSCDDNENNGNCESSPSCESSGPSCNNSLSCDSTCSNSNDQSGCNGNCNSCNSENSGGDQSGCGGECSDSDGGGGGGGGDDSGCSSDDSGGGDGGGCGGDSGNSNDGCSGDGCNGDNDCGGGSGSGGSSCGGDGGSSCGGSDGSGSSCGGDGGGGCGGGSGDSGCGGSGGGSSSSKCAVTPNVLPSKSGRVPPGLSFLMMVLWGLAPIPAAALARRRALRKGRTTGPLEQGDGDGESRAGSGEAGAARDAAPAASGDRVSKEAPDRESPDRESDPESGDRESEPRTTPASGSEGGAR